MSAHGTSTIKRPKSPPRASDRGRSRLPDITRPVQVDRRIARRRRSTFVLALAAIAIAGALAAALFVLPVRTYFGQDDEIAAKSAQLDQLEAVNDDLRSEVDRLRTEDGVREAAREELGFVEEGERRESILDLPPVPTDLPDGWPYSVVSGIVALRVGGPVVAAPAPGEVTVDPATADPATADPATADPATADPATADPATADPAAADPATADPATADPAAPPPTSAP